MRHGLAGARTAQCAPVLRQGSLQGPVLQGVPMSAPGRKQTSLASPPADRRSLSPKVKRGFRRSWLAWEQVAGLRTGPRRAAATPSDACSNTKRPALGEETPDQRSRQLLRRSVQGKAPGTNTKTSRSPDRSGSQTIGPRPMACETSSLGRLSSRAGGRSTPRFQMETRFYAGTRYSYRQQRYVALPHTSL
jgi:hypothetical protein